AGDAYVQSSDASSRPGTFDADASRRPAVRHRPDVPAGLIVMTEKTNRLSELLTGLDAEFDRLKQDPFSVTLSSTSANNAVRGYVSQISTSVDLEDARIKLLGRSGRLTLYRSEIGKQPADKRREIAAQINPLSSNYETLLQSKEKALRESALEARLNTESIDVTLPVREAPAEIGRVHPIT